MKTQEALPAPPRPAASLLLPALSRFLSSPSQAVPPDLVEQYVRLYLSWPPDTQEREAAQLMECMDSGNAGSAGSSVVVRAIMLASVGLENDEDHQLASAVPTSVPPSPDGSLPPGAMPVSQF